jgi:hypothetical protein
MKNALFPLFCGLVLLAACNTGTTPTPTPDPDPFTPTKPQAQYERSFGRDLSKIKPTMSLNQPYALTFTTSCSLQDLSNSKDLIYIADPKLGTVNMYSTALDGTNRKPLASAGFTNGKAELAFTPTEAGKFKLGWELELDGTTYTYDTRDALTKAIESKCKQLIAAESAAPAILGQYDIPAPNTFVGSLGFFSALNVTVQ